MNIMTKKKKKKGFLLSCRSNNTSIFNHNLFILLYSPSISTWFKNLFRYCQTQKFLIKIHHNSVFDTGRLECQKLFFYNLALARSFIFALWLKAVNMWLSIADGKHCTQEKEERQFHLYNVTSDKFLLPVNISLVVLSIK